MLRTLLITIHHESWFKNSHQQEVKAWVDCEDQINHVDHYFEECSAEGNEGSVMTLSIEKSIR